MFCTIRQYDGCTDISKLMEKVQSDLVPVIRDMAGYHTYFAIDCGNGRVISISAFETQEQAEQANQQVAPLVAQSLGEHITKQPTINIGEIKVENRK
jgi:hypothetical protein